MLDSTDTLLSLAEIGAAFAGFAALVSVLRRGSDKPAEAIHDLLRLRLAGFIFVRFVEANFRHQSHIISD